MSANERERIDTLCPHGRDEHAPPELAFLGDEYTFTTGEAMLVEPDNIEDGWIQAAKDVFVEVGSR